MADEQLLHKLALLSTDIIVRDKTVKIIQYGAKLVVGYYKARLSQEYIKKLRTLTLTSSNARKVFRLLKSINCLYKLQLLLKSDNLTNLDGILQILEQLFWTLFFYYDNLIFLARMKILEKGERDIERNAFLYWFLADVAKCASEIWSLHQTILERAQLRECMSLTNGINNKGRQGSYIYSSTYESKDETENENFCSRGISAETSVERLSIEKNAIQKVNQKVLSKIWMTAKAVIDIGVSQSFTPGISRAILRAVGKGSEEPILSEGTVGLLAVISSAMTVIEKIDDLDLLPKFSRM